ncbi:methylenetetrahydrofolate reductase [NAD(P)H] [Treponema sp.]|uniref:methylenetetrahydrofolate reductase [NAD(P)H] n=1 Tax=Treponema sp. TaxID=166 RepID=UPI003F0E8974
MKISEILESKKTLLSFEVFPPKQQANFESTVKTAKELCALSPDFMSVTYGAGGTTRENTVEISAQILSFGTPALAHLTCVGNSLDSIKSTVSEMKKNGIENILALRGDIPQGLPVPLDKDLEHADILVKILKQEGFCVGGACYPEGHPESQNRQDDIENLKYKIDAGVDFLTTQMFFDNNMLYSYLYQIQSKGIHVPVFAGIMPITNSSQVSRMVKLSSAYIPAKLLSICDRFSESPEAMRQAGIAYATDQIIDLISNGIRGIHIYTMNKPSVAQEIYRNVNSIISAINS